MENYDDYLTSQGVPQLPSAAAPSDSMPQGPADSGVTVAPVDAVAQRPQGMNYSSPDSVQSQQNVQQSMNSPSMQPQGGGANPGVWGLLPQNMQHGTLRNVLGALGDAFLVGSGKQAQYGPRMERQKEGLAMADYADHPEMAIGRVAATGTPDAMKYATALQENQNNMDVHRDQLAAQSQYRQDSLDQRKANSDALNQNRSDNQVRALMPQIGGLASRAQTPEQYQAAYTQAENIAQRIGKGYHAGDFGLIPPESWQPGTVQGTTAGQQMSNDAKTAQRGVSVSNNAANNRSRIRAARISAGAREDTAGMSVTERNIVGEADKNGIDSLTPAKRAVFDKVTNITKKTTPTLTPAAQAAAGKSPAGSSQQYSPAAAQALKPGTHYQGQNGKWYIR